MKAKMANSEIKRDGYRTLEIQGLMQELRERLIKAGVEQGGEFISITQQFIDEHIYEDNTIDKEVQ